MRISGNDGGSIAALQRSQTGQRLLAEAERRGVKIEFKPDNGDTTMGQYNPNNNTVTVESGNIEKMVETLAHELVHASTRENGNSMQEEKSAFIIGEKVAEEAGVNYNKHDPSYWANHVDRAYSGLANDNGILSSLYALGISPTGQDPLPANQRANNAANNTNNANYAANNANNFVAPNAAANNYADAANNYANAGNQLNNLNQQNPANNPMQQMMAGMLQMFMQMMQMMMQMFMQMQNGQQQNNNQQAQNPFGNNEQQALQPVNAMPFSLMA